MIVFDDSFYALVKESEELKKKHDIITNNLRKKYLNPLIERKDIEGLRSFIAQVKDPYARFCARDALTDLLENEKV